MKKTDTLFKVEITFEQILEAGSSQFKEYFNGLDEKQQEQFIQMNSHSIEMGCSYGLPISDVCSDIASNIEPESL